MRRAAVLIVMSLAAAGLSVLADAQQVERPPDFVDAAGMIHFMERPSFTVGTWAKYRTSSKSLKGYETDYTVTMLVAGEELFWGEPCVWIESWTKHGEQRERGTATLLSYSAFGDTMADKHLLWFIRKTIDGYRLDGTPDVAVYTREKSEIQLRREHWDDKDNPTIIDTLGTQSTTIQAGTFDVRLVRRSNAHAETAEQGDSTVYYERRLSRTYHYSPKIPLTRLVKVDIDDVQQGKTWKAGQFDRGPLKILERAQGESVLLEYGTTGIKPRLVPPSGRGTLDRKLIEEAIQMSAEPSAKPGSRRSSGSGS